MVGKLTMEPQGEWTKSEPAAGGLETGLSLWPEEVHSVLLNKGLILEQKNWAQANTWWKELSSPVGMDGSISYMY